MAIKKTPDFTIEEAVAIEEIATSLGSKVILHPCDAKTYLKVAKDILQDLKAEGFKVTRI